MLGVSDRGKIKGINITNNLKSNIHDIAHNLDPSFEIFLHCLDNVLIVQVPEEALREALLNSISHRNYFVSGTNIIVEIFSDRVEITNPGGLVKGITIEDLGRKSLSRNNLLFGLLQRMG